MNQHAKKQIALWVAVGGIMTLVVALWALLLPMQISEFSLIGARELSRWQVHEPQLESVSKSWDETMAKWRALLDEAAAKTQAELDAKARLERAEAEEPKVSRSDIEKLRAKIEAANSRNETE
jgi:hypothetical protein